MLYLNRESIKRNPAVGLRSWILCRGKVAARSFVFIFSAALLLANTCGGETARFADLLSNSPFVAGPSPMTSGEEVQLRGYMNWDHGMEFSVAKAPIKGRVRSAWLKLGDIFEDVKLVAFDQNSESVVISRAGIQQVVPLRLSRIAVVYEDHDLLPPIPVEPQDQAPLYRKRQD